MKASHATVLRLTCATETCTAECLLPADSHIPARWVCPVCEDHILAQQMDDLALRHAQTLAASGLSRPIRRIADF